MTAGPRHAYKYLWPALVLEAAFVLAPLLLSIYYSLHKVRYFELGAMVWFENYLDVLSHPVFLNSLQVTTTGRWAESMRVKTTRLLCIAKT